MTALVIIEGVVIALLVVLVAGLLRSHAEILRRLHHLEEGGEHERTPASLATAPAASTVAPQVATRSASAAGRAHDLTGVTPHGDAVAVRVTDTDRDTVLVFLSSGCGTCAAFWRRLAEPVDLPHGTRLVVVTAGPESESPSALADLAPPDLTVVMSQRAWTDYGVPGSPYVVHVEGETGTVVGEGTGQSWDHVARSLAQATGDTAFLGHHASAKARRDRDRDRDTDRELLAAGILPGDPRLYQAFGDDATTS